ncbi:hypothetical protein LHP98_08420 [Rhodobacter sp. Har01]|uniref:hypothetical protein n=1 Tax=Rhodobacter sp. Har01 TaxID=2883999 RepID=UPI001D0656EA|nr:hypothetical protein [Rhodobacter sp. Har01]MCB6178154.1 hypothetical protein [Rhodobacter sp. Har01]
MFHPAPNLGQQEPQIWVTLDKYMLRSGASLPGFEAICAISKGLEVSLDWLVSGADSAGDGVELFAKRAARHVVQLFAATLLRHRAEGAVSLVDASTILKLAPEESAADLGARAGEKARELVAQGTTKEDHS